MELSGSNFIGGRASARGSNSFFALNPMTSERLPTQFSEATEEEINLAVQAAESAFDWYRGLISRDRAAFLELIADEILALGDELLILAHLETGLPMARITGERGRTMAQLKMFASLIREGSWVEATIDSAIPTREPIPKPDLRKMLRPLGPVAVFGASNFPLAYSTAGVDTASALAAGCPVVLKAHPAHPGTSELVALAVLKAARETEMPDGVFSLLQGMNYELNLKLVTHPLIQAVGFTGSLQGGRAIFNAAANRSEPIPVYAEMGSVNPVFVLPRALQERGADFVDALVSSFTMGVGQFCTCPGVVIGMKGDELFKAVERVRKITVDLVPATMLHAGILQAFERGVAKFSELKGVSTVRASTPAEEKRTEARTTLFLTDAESFIAQPELREELFGPSTVVVSCDTFTQMEEIANGFAGQLTASIHGTAEDFEQFEWLVKILERKVGRLIVNGFPTGLEVCHSMTHGGPYPATTDSRTTSVGQGAIKRFVRPVSFQNFPNSLLPIELREENVMEIWRMRNGELGKM